MCNVKDAELDEAYVQGYMDRADEFEVLDDGLSGIRGVQGIGSFSLDNFPIVLIGATVANQLASKDELLNVHLDKLTFLQNKDTGEVRKEFRGGLKVVVAGIGVMMIQNPIAQAAALGVALSGANDLYDYARENKMFGLSGVGATETYEQPAYQEPEYAYSGLDYNDFGMNGYEDFEDYTQQIVDVEEERNSLRI